MRVSYRFIFALYGVFLALALASAGIDHAWRVRHEPHHMVLQELDGLVHPDGGSLRDAVGTTVYDRIRVMRTTVVAVLLVSTSLAVFLCGRAVARVGVGRVVAQVQAMFFACVRLWGAAAAGAARVYVPRYIRAWLRRRAVDAGLYDHHTPRRRQRSNYKPTSNRKSQHSLNPKHSRDPKYARNHKPL